VIARRPSAALVCARLCSSALACGLLACQDLIGTRGTCPALCAPGQIVVRDTVLAGSVEPVGSYRGYRLAHEATQVQIVGPGGPTESRAIIAFLTFSSRLSGTDTTVKDTIRQTDSIRFTFNVLRRNTDAKGVVLAIHRMPLNIDSATTYDGLSPYFDDSTLITTFSIPDSLKRGLVSTAVRLSALPNFKPDSVETAVGLRIRSTDPAFVSLGPSDSNGIAVMKRFVEVDTSNGSKRVQRSDQRGVLFKTFVVDTSRVPAPLGLLVGGVPAARALVKLNIDSTILDSTLIIRATLGLVPARAVFGAPGDTFRLRVEGVSADFGPKSPADSTNADSVRVAVGRTDTVSVEVTKILQKWSANSKLPRTVMLRVVPEAASINQFELATGQVGGLKPVVRITYGLPFRLSGR
jgi:hypothetical protein